MPFYYLNNKVMAWLVDHPREKVNWYAPMDFKEYAKFSFGHIFFYGIKNFLIKKL